MKKTISLSLLFICFFLVGCSSPAVKILSADNVYYYYLDAYNDKKCVQVYNESCEAQAAALNTLWTKLDRAKLALKRGGALPLQMKDVKEAEKGLKKVNKK